MTTSNFSARMMFVVALLLAGSGRAAEEESSSFKCPKLSKDLTVEEVFEGRMAALNAGNLDLAFCYYDEDVVVMLPGSVVRGREKAKKAFAEFGSIFGGVIPQPSTLTIAGDVALATFSLETPYASIQDGADTFMIRKGRIQVQTVHASISFHSP